MAELTMAIQRIQEHCPGYVGTAAEKENTIPRL